MKVKITLIETEVTRTRKVRKSILVDTDATPIFKNTKSTHAVQDVLYYEYLDDEVKAFLDKLAQQPIEEKSISLKEEMPVIEVEETDEQITLNCDYPEETLSPYETP